MGSHCINWKICWLYKWRVRQTALERSNHRDADAAFHHLPLPLLRFEEMGESLGSGFLSPGHLNSPELFNELDSFQQHTPPHCYVTVLCFRIACIWLSTHLRARKRFILIIYDSQLLLLLPFATSQQVDPHDVWPSCSAINRGRALLQG